MEYNERDASVSYQSPEQPMPSNQAQPQAQAQVQDQPQPSAYVGTQPGQEIPQQPVTYFVDQATGQMYYGVAPQQSQTLNPIQPPNPAQYVLYAAPQQTAQPSEPLQQPVQEPVQQSAAQQESASDQATAQAAAAQPDYSQVLKSVEDFAQGNATVSDVVKDFYTQTAQDDQFWKGAIVGAAVAVLLTSDSVRQAMGSTFASLFAGIAGGKAGAEASGQSEKSAAQE